MFSDLASAGCSCRLSRIQGHLRCGRERARRSQALGNWADAGSDGCAGVYPSVPAGADFIAVGCESGVAAVVNNIGMVYEAQGDLARPRRCIARQWPVFGCSRTRRTRPRLPETLPTNEWSKAICPARFNSIEAAAARSGCNCGYRERMPQSPVTTLRSSINYKAIWPVPNRDSKIPRNLAEERRPARFSGYGMWRLGNLLLQEDDFRGSRKMYEQALAIRTSAGEKLTMAQTQLSLADLSLEEARSAAEQEVVIHQVIEIFQTQKSATTKPRLGASSPVLCWRKISQRPRPMRSNTRGRSPQRAKIQKSIGELPSLRPTSRLPKKMSANPLPKCDTEGVGRCHRKVARAGLYRHRLDASLALAEIEIKAGQTTAGRAHLTAIETDAKAKGYNLIARKVAIARG